MTPINEVTLRKAIEKWGKVSQVEMVIEECSELITAIQHFKRGRVEPGKVAEEVADVLIMCMQLRLMVGEGSVDHFIRMKMFRLQERINLS